MACSYRNSRCSTDNRRGIVRFAQRRAVPGRGKAMTSGQDTQYAAWRGDSDAYWQHAANAIHWQVAPSQMHNLVDGLSNWFPDGRLNTFYNAVDRHVAGGPGGDAPPTHCI